MNRATLALPVELWILAQLIREMAGGAATGIEARPHIGEMLANGRCPPFDGSTTKTTSEDSPGDSCTVPEAEPSLEDMANS